MQPDEIGLVHYLLVSALVFGVGTSVIIVRRNVVAVLMGVELVLNAAALNFVAFARYVGYGKLDGHILALFVIVIAAAEAAVALAIVLNFFNNFSSVHVDDGSELRQ